MALTWQQHQQNIFGGESGGDYDALFGYQNRPDGIFSGIKVSEMPIADVIKFTSPTGAYGQYVKGQVGRVATPVGAYQVVGSTLRGAVEALGLDPSQKFDKATQDKIGQYILKTQGTGAWEGYGKGGAAMAQADAGDSLARAYYDAVATGTLKGGAAVANYLKDSQTGTKDTALIRQALAAGLKQGTPEFQRYILSGGDIYSQETALLASLPKPEKGMRYQFDKDETGTIINYRLVPITGSEADKEAEQIQQAAEAQRSAQSASGMVVLEDIGKAIDIAKESPFLSTGFVGGVLRNIGGTAAKDLASLTTTIKANIGFDRLQRMREESPTGGALGQVAVQELEALQSTLGNLDNSQSNEQVVSNLERLEAQYRKSMREIYNAALADQKRGLVNKRTGQPVSPMDYFSEADIAMLSGQTQAAPAQTQPRTDDDLLKKYGG